MWRLLGGELLWALRQVVAAPWVLSGLLVGFVGTLLVLGAGAPGPVADPPWRVLIAVAVGLLLAAGGRAILGQDASLRSEVDREGQVRPMTAATIVASVIAVATLMVWFAVWLVMLLA